MAVIVVLFFACGSGYPLMYRGVEHRAALLREYCRTHEITQPEILTAENLYTRAEEIRKDNPDRAIFLLDQAHVTYRLALLRHEMDVRKKERNRLELSLQGNREELDYYRQALAELIEMRQVPADSAGAGKMPGEAADE